MGTTRTCSSCGEEVAGTLDRCPKDGTPLFAGEIMARVGKLLKDHEILSVIGDGGMGVVYRARHVVIEKPVAIKVLHDRFARQKEMVEQFIIEAKAASRIRHPNIIDVTDFGTAADGMVFLVMEYLDGESLETRLYRVRRLPPFEAINIVSQVASGLGAAHEQGVIHRDLKPANIFLCVREGRRRIVRRTADESGAQFAVEPEQTFDFVKLLDFGVAKFMDLGPSAATRAGMFCGTPHYLSPEQAQEKPATERSDIYALGAVLYEMVTGFVPFDGSSMLEILTGHVAGDVIAPSKRATDAGIDQRLDAVISKCLEKDPARRFANTDELRAALAECVTDRVFLRDAHRLPGIKESGFDLAEATPSARRLSTPVGSPAVLAKDGFKAVENETPEDDWSELDDEPEGKARFPGDTMRIRRQQRGRAVVLVVTAVLLVAGAGIALWRWGGGVAPEPTPESLVAGAATQATKPASVPPTPPPVVADNKPSETPSAAGAAGKPTPTPSSLAEKPSAPKLAAGHDKAAGDSTSRSASHRATQALAGEVPSKSPPARRSAPPPMPVLPVPVPPPIEPVVAAPPPAPAPAPVEPVDVDALLKDAQQAWARRYYALAIEKARAALKAAPGRQAAYQIIAASSCALGEAADAREAASHLDEHKRRLVYGLCERNGVKLE